MKITGKMLKDMVKTVIIISILALVLSVIFPWITLTDRTDSVEGSVWIPNIGHSEIVEEEEELASAVDNIERSELALISTLFFASIVKIGIALNDSKRKRLSRYLTLTSIPMLISSILALVFSVLAVLHLHDMEGYFGMGFNYGPLALSAPLVFISAAFCIMIVPRTIRELRTFSSEYSNESEKIEGDGVRQREYNYVLRCSSCGVEVKEGALVCPRCGTALGNLCDMCGSTIPHGESYCLSCRAGNRSEDEKTM